MLTQGGFVVGLPGESEVSIRRTVEWFLPSDSPLDGIIMEPLHIESNPRYPFRSKIDRDPEGYGFDFDQATGNWSSPTMTRAKAEELAASAMHAIRERNINSGFAYPLFKNLGLTEHDARRLTFAEHARRAADLSQRLGQMKRRYLDTLLAGKGVAKFSAEVGRPGHALEEQCSRG